MNDGGSNKATGILPYTGTLDDLMAYIGVSPDVETCQEAVGPEVRCGEPD